MSLRRTIASYPALLRIGFAEAIAYRAEMFVWVLSTTMPLIMMALWTAVAREAPVGRFGAAQFSAYFLATFIARQLTGSWIAWQMNFEIRQGTLAMRLLRPVDPLGAYASEVLAALPLRVGVAVPVAAVLLLTTASQGITHDPFLWAAWFVALAGGWLLTFLINVFIGALALFMGSSLKLLDVYFALFFVLGGYTIPVELLPNWLGTLSQWLPFRYLLGAAVEILTGRFDRLGALGLLARQLLCILVVGAIALTVWRRGLRRFAAYGG